LFFFTFVGVIHEMHAVGDSVIDSITIFLFAS